MILALILATLDQLPTPEECILDTRDVMTPLAFRAFPGGYFENARKRAGRQRSKTQLPQNNKIPSLVELLIHYARTRPDCLGDRNNWEEELENRGLLKPLQDNPPFYHHYDTTLSLPERSRRKGPLREPRTVYLTTASLIVVPDNLVGQWSSEIIKHCAGIRYVMLKNSSKLPSARELASDYDVSGFKSMQNCNTELFG